MQFFIDLQSCINGEGSHLSKQQISNGCIEASPENMLADLLRGMVDVLSLADVFRDEARSLLGLTVAYHHAIATLSTDDQSLQECRSFSGWAMATVASKDLTVLLQLLAVRFIFLPGNVTNMAIAEEEWPLFLGKRLDLH